MSLEKETESCEKFGHPGVKSYLTYRNIDGSFEAECYCRTCKIPFIRDSTPEEIAEYNRIQSLSLRRYIP